MTDFQVIFTFVKIEFFILTVLLVFLLIIGLYITYKESDLKNKRKIIKIIINNTIAQKTQFDEKLFMPSLRKMQLIIPVLEEYDQKFTSPFWSLLKDRLIHEYMEKELYQNITSRNKWMNSLAFRALSLSPKIEYGKYLSQFMQKKASFLHFQIIPYISSVASLDLLRQYFKLIISKNKAIQISFVNALLEKDGRIIQYVKEIYLEVEDDRIRLMCLRILAKKISFPSSNFLEKDMHSENINLQWWAIRALENTPSEKTRDFLLQNYTHSYWQVRVLIFFLLGKYREQNTLDTLQLGLSDPHEWVKVAAGFSLLNFETQGMEILQKNPQIEQYVQAMDPAFFTKYLDVVADYL